MVSAGWKEGRRPHVSVWTVAWILIRIVRSIVEILLRRDCTWLTV